MTYPSRLEAEKELELGNSLNPGVWTEYSRFVAKACEFIADAAGMDANKAFTNSYRELKVI